MKPRALFAAGSAAALVTALGVAVLASVPAASASGPAGPGQLVPAGQVQLQTGATNRLVYVDGDSSTTDPTQAIGTQGKCNLTPTSGGIGSWSVAPSNAVPGFAYGAIGVNGAKQNGTACSQVESGAGESLTLNLDGTSLTSFLGPLVATAARLDIEVKFDAVVRADLLASDGTVVDTFRLYSGSNATSVTAGSHDYPCQLRSDSGPDSGANDNCTWAITPAAGTSFSGIRLTATTGQFDLKGGGDYSDPSNHYTLFSMAAKSDGTLNCDTANVATVSGSGQLGGIEITRLPNGDGGGCTAIDYTLGASGGTATFHKPDDGQVAQFTTAIQRTFDPVAVNPVPALAVDWEDGAGAHNLGFCSDAMFSGSGASPSFDWTQLTQADDQSSASGLQYACVYAQSDNLQDDGTVISTDHVYFTGDIKFTTR